MYLTDLNDWWVSRWQTSFLMCFHIFSLIPGSPERNCRPLDVQLMSYYPDGTFWNVGKGQAQKSHAVQLHRLSLRPHILL